MQEKTIYKCIKCGGKIDSVADFIGTKVENGVNIFLYQCPYCRTKQQCGGSKVIEEKIDTVHAYSENMPKLLLVTTDDMANFSYGVMIGGGYILMSKMAFIDGYDVPITAIMSDNTTIDDAECVYVRDGEYLALLHSDTLANMGGVTFVSHALNVGQSVFVLSAVRCDDNVMMGMHNASITGFTKDGKFTIDRVDGNRYLGGLVTDGSRECVGILAFQHAETHSLNYVYATADIKAFVDKASDFLGEDIPLQIK